MRKEREDGTRLGVRGGEKMKGGCVCAGRNTSTSTRKGKSKRPEQRAEHRAQSTEHRRKKHASAQSTLEMA
eukprot:3909415-Rhodomonas_salina.2